MRVCVRVGKRMGGHRKETSKDRLYMSSEERLKSVKRGQAKAQAALQKSLLG